MFRPLPSPGRVVGPHLLAPFLRMHACGSSPDRHPVWLESARRATVGGVERKPWSGGPFLSIRRGDPLAAEARVVNASHEMREFSVCIVSPRRRVLVLSWRQFFIISNMHSPQYAYPLSGVDDVSRVCKRALLQRRTRASSEKKTPQRRSIYVRRRRLPGST